jgi:hypothetical protein
MEDRDLYYVKEYHQRLIATSVQEHRLQAIRLPLPGLRDYLLNRAGSTLIALGQRLQSASLHKFEQPADLTQECA